MLGGLKNKLYICQFVLVRLIISVNMEMKVLSKTHGESMAEEYFSPNVKVVFFQSEGILCLSGTGHDGFVDGGEYDL